MRERPTDSLRVVSWNCRRAISGSPLWEYLVKLDPDIALLQEVGSLSDEASARYGSLWYRSMGPRGSLLRTGTAVLVKGRIGDQLKLTSSIPWVQEELDHFTGNLVGAELLPIAGPPVKVISVHSPAWPVDPKRLARVDTDGVRLTLNPDVWVADLLRASLREVSIDSGELWLVGGDFNLSETFDSCPGAPRGNREYLDEMADLGWNECLRACQGGLVPTFKNARGGAVKHQMDHVFVSSALASRLIHCDAGTSHEVLDAGLSDRLPIIADFVVPGPIHEVA